MPPAFCHSQAAHISGSLTVAGTLQTSATLGVQGLAAFAYPTVADFYITRTGGNRVLQFSNNAKLVWTESNGYFSFVWGTQVTMSLDTSGNLAIGGASAYKVGGSASWIVTSDDRVKRNPRSYISGLKEICALHPISFLYTGEGGTVDDGRRYIGLSAQATLGVMPELVSEMPSGYLAIDHRAADARSCNAVRELADRVTALEHAA